MSTEQVSPKPRTIADFPIGGIKANIRGGLATSILFLSKYVQVHICPLQFSSSDWVSAYVAASLVGLLPWVGSYRPHGCPEQVSQKCCSEDNPISLYKARSNPLVQLVLCRKRIKSPSNCIFCQAQPNPCYSWAKLTLSSISLAILAAQH